MSIKSFEVVASALLSAFGLWIVMKAFDLGIVGDAGPDSGTFPLIAGLLIAVFAGASAIRTFRDGQAGSEAIGLGEVGRIGAIIFFMAAYLTVFTALGPFLPLPFLLIAVSLVIHWQTDLQWLATLIAISIVFTAICYYVFAVFLRVLLPMGPFGF